jgi:hypothetical protein
MKTFMILDRMIPADASASVLEKAMKKAEQIKATTPRAAAKIHYLRARRAKHRIAKGHRNPPETAGEVKIVEKVEGKIGNERVVRFTLGQPRKDGVLTHFETIAVAAVTG